MPANDGVVSSIAGRYATALFDLAREQDRIDEIAADLAGLRRMIGESADLERLVRSPMFARDVQARAMGAVLERAGAGETVRNFVGLVARNRRLFALADMARAFAALVAAHRGEVVAQVSAAHALDARHVAALKAELAAALKTEVTVETSVDEDLLGGLVVRVGSRMIDSSLRTKLQNLKFAMKGVG